MKDYLMWLAEKMAEVWGTDEEDAQDRIMAGESIPKMYSIDNYLNYLKEEKNNG